MTWWQEVQKRFAFDLTWWQEFKKKFVSIPTWRQKLKTRFPTAPLVLRQENKRRHAPRVSHNFAVRIPLRQLEQTRFCWPFNNWRQTVIQPISTTTSVESRNCLNLSQPEPTTWANNLSQQIRTHSETVPETFRNTNVDNQGTNEDDFQSDPHPEAGLFRNQTTQHSGPEVGPYNCLLPAERNHLKGNIIFGNFLSFRSFSVSWQKFSSRVLKPAYYLSSGNFVQVSQKGNICVQRNIRGKIVFLNKKQFNFALGIWAKRFPLFVEKLLAGFFKLRSTCPDKTFEGNRFFEKISFFNHFRIC